MARHVVSSGIENRLTTIQSELRDKPERKAQEFIPPLAMFLQGMAWGNPTNTFSLSRNYTAMGQIAPEQVWSFIWIAVGLASLLCVVSKNLLARRVAALVVGVLFFLVASSFLFSNPQNTYSFVVFAVSAQSLMSYVQLGVNHEQWGS